MQQNQKEEFLNILRDIMSLFKVYYESHNFSPLDEKVVSFIEIFPEIITEEFFSYIDEEE